MFFVGRGRYTELFLECGGEIVWIGKTSQFRHFGYALFFFTQQGSSLFQSTILDELPGGLVGQFFQFAVQMHAAGTYL